MSNSREVDRDAATSGKNSDGAVLRPVTKAMATPPTTLAVTEPGATEDHVEEALAQRRSDAARLMAKGAKSFALSIRSPWGIV